MVYLKHWNDFKAQALALYAKSPDRTRFVLKARPSAQVLVLKLTDDHTTLKYRAKSSIILNRLEEFQRKLLEDMSGVLPAPTLPTPAAAAPPTPTPAESSSAHPAHDTTQKAPSKSKNKKKGKKK